jgi:chaperonin GroES
MSNIIPLGDKIVVERAEVETVSQGGIFIPDTAAEKPDQGIVKAVGAGKYNERGIFVENLVSVGDRIIFSKTAGQTIEVEKVPYLILRNDDVIAKIS